MTEGDRNLQQADGPARQTSSSVLIVDDELLSRKIISKHLRSAGYTTLMAEDGQEGIDVYVREQPDIVIMDVMMPRVDGYEATQMIKKKAGERFVPVICLTSLEDEKGLAKCVEVGADDFLSKPVTATILKAKIDAMMRIRELYNTVRNQKKQLRKLLDEQEREQAIAEKVFSRVVRRGCLDAPNLRHWVSSMALFNGDTVLAARRPSGELNVLVGDFTGHGLSAAIGVIPLCETFYSMTAKGFGLNDIILEINGKLKEILPSSLFLAAGMAQVDSRNGAISVWIGAFPDVYVVGKEGGIKRRLKSRNLPLGVVDNDTLNSTAEVMSISEGDRIFFCTDGVTEARGPDGEMFGEKRLEECIARNQGDSVLDAVLADVSSFCGSASQSDDVTMMEITCCEDATGSPETESPEAPKESVLKGPTKSPLAWKIAMDLTADRLRDVNPVPMVLGILMEDEALSQHKENIFLILSELFTNALEHGILRLDSSLKKDPEGFAQYWEAREKALAELEEGSIKIEVEHVEFGEGGKLVVRLEDTGPGFNYSKDRPSLDENVSLAGRGIPLVSSLCKELTFYGNGNQVEAVYEWT